MEEIKVGEYVRTKEYGDIGKLFKITSTKAYLDSIGYAIDRKEIINHSKNIIDLIEVGDYVNGHKIEEIWEDADNYRLAGCDYMFEITEKDIKSIVTKEQFKSMEYSIGE